MTAMTVASSWFPLVYVGGAFVGLISLSRLLDRYLKGKR